MAEGGPPVVCIFGKKNSGKTELTVALAAELMRRGRRVMTVKHGHGFQVDRPGTDSWRHRHEGGALRTVMAGPRDFAVVGGWPAGEMSLEELVRRFLWDAEIVLVEGFKASSQPKIEVFRAGAHSRPVSGADASESSTHLALVTDAQGFETPVPVYDMGDPRHVSSLADLLEERFLKGEDRGMNPDPLQEEGRGSP